MKKGLIAILAILYMTITSGVMVNVHYCMGRIASVEYGYDDDHDLCNKCGMAGKKSKCCHTESKLVKVDDAHQWVKSNVSFAQAPAEQPVQQPLIQHPIAGRDRYLALQYHSPPDPRSNPVSPPNCFFRI